MGDFKRNFCQIFDKFPRADMTRAQYQEQWYDSQDMETTRVCQWMDKEDALYVCSGVSFMNKKEILPFAATWMKF